MRTLSPRLLCLLIVQTHGKRTPIDMRCLSCGLEWTAERTPLGPPRERS